MKKLLSKLKAPLQRIGIVDRYVASQILVGSGIAVLILSFVLVLANVFKRLLPKLVESEVPLSYLVKFMGMILPFSLVFTVPWGFLTAVLLVFGRLSADNELISLRMAGSSMPRICAAVFAIATALSLGSLWFNTNIAPRAEAGLKGMLYKLAVDNPMALFNAQEVTDDLPGYVFYVGDKTETQLKDMHMVKLEGNRPVAVIRSPHAEVAYEKGEDDFRLVMKNAEVEAAREGAGNDPREVQVGTRVEEFTVPIPLQALQKNARLDRPGMKVTSVLRQQLADSKTASKEKKLKPRKESAIRTEISRRYSFSMACLTFALVGIPLGITAQRRETSVGFALSLVIGCVYFLFIILADTFRENPSAHPHLLMWLPNIVFLSLGGWLFYRLCKR